MTIEYEVGEEESIVVVSPEETAFDRLLRGSRRSLVGRGVIRPFQRDGKRDFLNAEGIKLIESMIIQILGTRASSASGEGELPWRTEFGSWLHMLRHAGNDELTTELSKRYAVDALKRWLPQIVVTHVRVETTKTRKDQDTLWLLVSFEVKRQRDARTDVRHTGTARVPLSVAA